MKSPIPEDVLRTVAEANERIARISSPDLDVLQYVGVDLGTIEAARSERALLDTVQPEYELLETVKSEGEWFETLKPEHDWFETLKPEREWLETLRPTFEAMERTRTGWLKLGTEVMPQLPNLEVDADLYRHLISPELSGVSFIAGEVETANTLAAELQLMGEVAAAARKVDYQDIAQAAEATANDAEAEPAELNLDALIDRLNDLAAKLDLQSGNPDSISRIVLITIIANTIWYLIQVELLTKLGIRP